MKREKNNLVLVSKKKKLIYVNQKKINNFKNSLNTYLEVIKIFQSGIDIPFQFFFKPNGKTCLYWPPHPSHLPTPHLHFLLSIASVMNLLKKPKFKFYFFLIKLKIKFVFFITRNYFLIHIIIFLFCTHSNLYFTVLINLNMRL